MSSDTSRAFHETHEVHETPALTTFSRQRQQQSTSDPTVPSTPSPSSHRSSASGSARLLRRVTSRLSDRRASYPGAVPVHAATRDDPSFRPAERAVPISPQPVPDPAAAAAPLRPSLSEAETEGAESIAHEYNEQLLESHWPVRSTRVSPRTASAILWVLEEGIRKPFPFTPDWDEINASMSDLVSGGGSLGVGGNVRSQNGGSRQGAVPVHTYPPSGVRTPTDIMRQRRDREARKKAEKEAKEREQQEAEWRQQQEQEQRLQQAQTQQYAAAGVASQTTSQLKAGAEATQATGLQQTAPASAGTRGQSTQAESRVAGDGGAQERQRGSAVSQGQPRPVPAASQQPAPASTSYPQQQYPQAQTKGPGMSSQAAPQVAPGASQGQQTQAQSNQGQASQPQQQPRRAPFPHAFERWETLSSHWEGLTSYWIRKLQQNNEELSRDPLSQQMARQITDLSAAGANLFHAVVELQRLRASSERKFQRWFFDTRAEQERAREIQADLERQLRAERQERAEAVAKLKKLESEKKKADELIKEMRRELQISKEEARRAWEELGRREQEERDRTASLRNGQPTLVGGVQVVPMIPRQTGMNRPPTREGPYPGGPGMTGMGGQKSTEESHYYGQQPSSPTGTDPFTESERPLPDEPGAPSFGASPSGHSPTSATMSGARPGTSHGQAQPTGRFYQHEGSALHGGPQTSQSPAGTGSDMGEEYAVDPDGGYRRDPQGRQIVYPRAMSEGSDDYEEEPEREQGYGHHYMSGVGYGSVSAPTTSAPFHSGYGVGSVDYSGSGWGGWDSITPRHRHPTRLSDVIEEDERSRTSPSRASQASRGAQ